MIGAWDRLGSRKGIGRRRRGFGDRLLLLGTSWILQLIKIASGLIKKRQQIRHG
jgi:hypothetical protein